MLGRALARVIWIHAGVSEGIEFRVGPDELTHRGPCIGLSQTKCDFTDDFVTLISPRPSIAAERHESQQQKQKIAHTRSLPMTDYPITQRLWRM